MGWFISTSQPWIDVHQHDSDLNVHGNQPPESMTLCTAWHLYLPLSLVPLSLCYDHLSLRVELVVLILFPQAAGGVTREARAS